MDYIDAIKDRTNVVKHLKTGKIYLVHFSEIDHRRQLVKFTLAGENHTQLEAYNDELEYVNAQS